MIKTMKQFQMENTKRCQAINYHRGETQLTHYLICSFTKIYYTYSSLSIRENKQRNQLAKGHSPSADLRYGEEDSISITTLILAAIKG